MEVDEGSPWRKRKKKEKKAKPPKNRERMMGNRRVSWIGLDLCRRSCGVCFPFIIGSLFRGCIIRRIIYSREASGGMVGIGSCEDGRLMGTVYDFLYDGYV